MSKHNDKKHSGRKGVMGTFLALLLIGALAIAVPVIMQDKFFVMRGHPVTAELVSMLIRDGHVFLKNLHSAKSGKTYNTTVYLNDPGEGAPQFRLGFEKKGKA